MVHRWHRYSPMNTGFLGFFLCVSAFFLMLCHSAEFLEHFRGGRLGVGVGEGVIDFFVAHGVHACPICFTGNEWVC